ncbi:LIP-domain-containing protein [Thozetella sp. PMI_491]|nr:LIP-domain-containing protein [Thozetella sp. PMI_491]
MFSFSVPEYKASRRIGDSIPIPPSQDPFYTPPCGFEHTEPGRILRTRQALGLVSIIANSSDAYSLLYRTTGTRGQPSWAVTTLLVPANTSATLPKKLVSYNLAYDTPAVDWSPSYGLYNIYSTPTGSGFPADSTFISEILGRGWYVTVPDYEGPEASFIEGPQSGYAVIDAVRASIMADAIDSSDVQTALWGYSGGGFATAWAAELQPVYAPDLKIIGAAVGAPPTNLSFSFEQINKSLFQFLIPTTLIGLVSQFPDANASFANALHTDGPFNATVLYQVTKRSANDNREAFAYQDILDYMVDKQPPLELPFIVDLVTTQTVLGKNGTPQMPYFMYSAIDDRVVGISGMDALVDQYCSSNATVLFQRNTVGGHVAEITNGVPRVFDFLDAVFGGNFVPGSGCRIENVTVALVTTPDPL